MKACEADPRWTSLKCSKISARMTGRPSLGGVVALLAGLLVFLGGHETKTEFAGAGQAK